MKKKIISSILIIVVVSSTIILINKKEKLKEPNNLISYTVNGEKVKEKPSKETGYKARTITCDNKSNLVWDNTNWEAEIIKSETLDICNIDFTKEEDKLSYRVEVTTNIPEGIDSVSKTTIKNGNITFYPKEGYTIKEVSGCEKGSIEEGKLIVKNITNKETCNITIESTTLKDKILLDHPTRSRRTNFDEPFIAENTKTLFVEEGDYTEGGNPVYYFAGNALDNWVVFGKDQEDNDLYWRIIRINEDGSIRLLYIGPDPATENAFIKIDGVYMSGGSTETGIYNEKYGNTMYVGYMYGTEGSLENNRQNTTNSSIKQKIDDWYSKTINTKTDASGNIYNKYISETAIYCNDRSGDAYFSDKTMGYGAFARLFHAYNGGRRPSYKCGDNSTAASIIYDGLTWMINNKTYGLYNDANVADKFSKTTTGGGNGQLTYPIALITADEVAFSGGVYAMSATAWYYYNSVGGSVVGDKVWYTMTPMSGESKSNGIVFTESGDGTNSFGFLAGWHSHVNGPGIRPVLSLKSCVKWSSGDGSTITPYTVSIDSTCSTAEN